MSLAGFNSKDHDTETKGGTFQLMPDMIADMEVVETKEYEDGNNLSIHAKVQIIEPAEFAGRYIFEWINYNDDTPSRQEWGQRRLAMYCEATEVFKPNSPSDLHRIRFRGRIGKTKPYTNPRTGEEKKIENTIWEFFYPENGFDTFPDVGVIGGKKDEAKPATQQQTKRDESAAEREEQPAEKPKAKRVWG